VYEAWTATEVAGSVRRDRGENRGDEVSLGHGSATRSGHPSSVVYLLRVALPDRPGTLGALATALGEAGADILSLDVVAHHDDVAIDDVLVDLPMGRLADTLLTAVYQVEGASVESLRPWSGGADLRRDLELVEAFAAEPCAAMTCLAEESPGVFRAGWGLLVIQEDGEDIARVLAGSAAAPEIKTLDLPVIPLKAGRRIGNREDWVPDSWRALGTELAVVPVGRPERALLLGRAGGPRFLDSEIMRLTHLAGLAATVEAGAR